jgi:hypothetical protein
MNKISMDALNAGWSIGFGTRVAPRHDEFEYFAARQAARPEPEHLPTPIPAQNALARFFAGIEAAILTLARPASN